MSLAGPAANFTVALLAFVALRVMLAQGLFQAPLQIDIIGGLAHMVEPTSGDSSSLVAFTGVFLSVALNLNVLLGLFNLLPIPPLDGSHILAGISPRMRELYGRPQAQIFGLFIFIAIFFMSPIGGLFFELGWRGAVALTDLVGSLVGNPSVGQVI